MTYRVYIKKDYKPKVIWVKQPSKHWRLRKWVVLALLISSAGLILGMGQTEKIRHSEVLSSKRLLILNPTEFKNSPVNLASEIPNDEVVSVDNRMLSLSDNENEAHRTIKIEEQDLTARWQKQEIISEEINWQKIIIKEGDNLALIFSKLGLNPNKLYQLMSLGKEVSILKKLKPGQILNFHIEANELLAIEYEIDDTRTLKVSKLDNTYQVERIDQELDTTIKNATVIIKNSLFLSGKKAGLSDNLIMQLVSIYNWDIDFALDIREGDELTVIYEEQSKDNIKVSDGPVIAAEFLNQNKVIRAIRYTHDDGSVDYYSDNGDAMRKTFLRTPVNFVHISSHFNLNRKHPILNTIRAHRGVDYAAPTGTPVKATGNGIVTFAGKKGDYGKTIILKHGTTWSTVYAHLHKYANNIRSGKRVKQGQIIGYVGKSGLATGPHLHYEFRINGVHQNPLTIKFPKIESIKKENMPIFQEKVAPILAELDRLTGERAFASKQRIPIISKIPSTTEGG